jgi:hypothetical protein
LEKRGATGFGTMLRSVGASFLSDTAIEELVHAVSLDSLNVPNGFLRFQGKYLYSVVMDIGSRRVDAYFFPFYQ